VWLPDSSGLLAALVPADLGAAPEPSLVPAGPVIEETAGRTAPGRTWQDLLANPHDEAMFEHVFTAALGLLQLDGRVEQVVPPSLLWSFSPSPDGRYLLVEALHRPFSYRVPAFRFPRAIDVLERSGRRAHRVADLPLQEEVPITFGSVPTGPRNVHWRADAPATVAWVEALDGGDAKAEAAERDRLLALAAPFAGAPTALATLDLRFDGVTWGNDGTALVTSSWWQTRREKVLRIAPGAPSQPGSVLFDRQYEDRYNDPGNPLVYWNDAGRPVLRTADGGRALVLVGAGASPEGDRPVLDIFDLAAGRGERLFRSAAPVYEQPLKLLGPASEDPKLLLVRRESVTEPPNYFVRNLATGDLRQLTRFPHPTPQLAGFGKELIRYRRNDGVELTGTLYTPPGWKPADGPLPTLLWAYPNEFKSADAASQVRDSPYRFDRVDHWSSLIWLALGYAVLDDPAMPIVGEGDVEPNDTYVQQLVASAQAAVDELVRRGVSDPKRIAVGGHSYGGFMTANLLAHSDLFAAGIARSGAYNRTLTPFGFQSEERTYWEAPEVYFAMSPFQNANKIDEPILLIHGQASTPRSRDSAAPRASCCCRTRATATAAASRCCTCSGSRSAGSNGGCAERSRPKRFLRAGRRRRDGTGRRLVATPRPASGARATPGSRAAPRRARGCACAARSRARPRGAPRPRRASARRTGHRSGDRGRAAPWWRPAAPREPARCGPTGRVRGLDRVAAGKRASASATDPGTAPCCLDGAASRRPDDAGQSPAPRRCRSSTSRRRDRAGAPRAGRRPPRRARRRREGPAWRTSAIGSGVVRA
jgi:dipeptidyl aminopeptidase/acylaminoacyl peptidase